MTPRPFRIAIETLGCKVNQADSDHLAEAFAAAGCVVVPAAQPADAYVVNTCTVTLVADRKARKLVRQVARANPQAVIAVTGCYAEGLGRTLFERLPEVEVVRGTPDRDALPAAVPLDLRRRRALGLLPDLTGAVPAPASRPRAMLKVQDGCEHVCSYCIVPSVRGGHRSRPLDAVLHEARRRLDAGARELVLCGVRLGAYGWDRPGRQGSRFTPLVDLTTALGQLAGLRRLRLSSILPLDVGPQLFAHLASIPAVCEHLHLPLQSGDDALLRAMRRGYTTTRFEALCDQAREHLGDLAIATDVMVGHPGESVAAFEQTLAFCQRVGFADMHLFQYSARPGTAAAALADDVSPAEKQARSRALQQLRDELRTAFAARRLGRETAILVETSDDGCLAGLTRDYLRVEAPGQARVGDEVPVRLSGLAGDTLRGQRTGVVAAPAP